VPFKFDKAACDAESALSWLYPNNLKSRTVELKLVHPGNERNLKFNLSEVLELASENSLAWSFAQSDGHFSKTFVCISADQRTTWLDLKEAFDVFWALVCSLSFYKIFFAH